MHLKFVIVGYVEDPKGHVTKMLVEDLLFRHDIKPPYTNADQWNIKKIQDVN
jgi:hypothetical protein